MWLRTALFLILALVAWKFISGLVHRLSAPSRRPDPAIRPGPGDSPPSTSTSRREWPPADVVDVPYRDVDQDGAPTR